MTVYLNARGKFVRVETTVSGPRASVDVKVEAFVEPPVTFGRRPRRLGSWRSFGVMRSFGVPWYVLQFPPVTLKDGDEFVVDWAWPAVYRIPAVRP